MNFPNTQWTGAVAEQVICSLFTDWQWVVGKDHIDVGYDWSIQPDRERFKGARFLVQSKGTAKSAKGGITAQVSKKRLRHYAENPHPVFILRVMPDKTIYWLHAQEWTRANQDKLLGDGKSTVRFDQTRTLTSKEEFTAYLEKVLAPPHERLGSLRELSRNRSNYLNTIDPRFRVKVTTSDDGNETYDVYGTPQPQEVTGTFSFRPTEDGNEVTKLQDSMDFGTPISLNVEEFQLDGSPLFEAIGANEPVKGTVNLEPANATEGCVFLYPGKTRSITTREISLPSQLCVGAKGMLVLNKERSSALEFEFRIQPKEESFEVNIHFSVDTENLCNRPAHLWHEFDGINEWIEQVIAKEAIGIEMLFLGKRGQFIVIDDLIPLGRFLSALRIFARLQSLAKYFKSSLTLPDGHELSVEEINDIHLAYQVLRGERCSINYASLPFTFNPADVPVSPNNFYITTELMFAIAGQELGPIPVQIENLGFTLEPINAAEGRYNLCANEKSESWISYFDGNLEPLLSASPAA